MRPEDKSVSRGLSNDLYPVLNYTIPHIDIYSFEIHYNIVKTHLHISFPLVGLVVSMSDY